MCTVSCWFQKIFFSKPQSGTYSLLPLLKLQVNDEVTDLQKISLFRSYLNSYSSLPFYLFILHITTHFWSKIYSSICNTHYRLLLSCLFLSPQILIANICNDDNAHDCSHFHMFNCFLAEFQPYFYTKPLANLYYPCKFACGWTCCWFIWSCKILLVIHLFTHLVSAILIHNIYYFYEQSMQTDAHTFKLVFINFFSFTSKWSIYVKWIWFCLLFICSNPSYKI